VERARLLKAPNEGCFGVQIATNQISEGVRAAQMAKDAGASFIDLNCGCPIYGGWGWGGWGVLLLRWPGCVAMLSSSLVLYLES